MRKISEVKGWSEIVLGEIGSTYNGLTGKTKDDFGAGKPFVTYLNVFSNNKIDISQVGYVRINEGEKQNKVLYGDILFTTSSETAEEVGMASSVLDFNGELYLNSFCFGFRPNNLNILLPEFSRYLFRSSYVRKTIVELAQGSTRFNLSKVALLNKLKLLLPPLPEQQKIAEILSTVDEKIEVIEAQINQNTELKKGLMQQLLTKGIGHTKFKDSPLGKIPESWEVVKFGDLVINLDSQRVPLKSEDRSNLKGIYPYYGAQGIIDYIDKYIFEGEFLLIAEDGENVRSRKYDIAFIASGKFWLNNHAHIVSSNEKSDLYFLKNFLNFISISEYITGQAQPKLNKSALESIKIICPPIREQQEIGEIISAIDSKIASLTQKCKHFTKLKKGLMQQLLTGKLRVNLNPSNHATKSGDLQPTE